MTKKPRRKAHYEVDPMCFAMMFFEAMASVALSKDAEVQTMWECEKCKAIASGGHQCEVLPKRGKRRG